MSQTAREYLIHRFRGDAQALNERVGALQRGAKVPGPDAATSRKMAEACESVTAMLEAIVPHADRSAELSAVIALIPLLEQRARDTATLPPVRAVFTGAATRIREIEAAEASAAVLAADPINDDDIDDLDREIDEQDIDEDDEDIDDDELPDDGETDGRGVMLT